MAKCYLCFWECCLTQLFLSFRSKNSQGINSTLAFGQMVANQPGQTTTQVRVPYRVVGLVVGPKGATIKRIQQATHTYIVTPSRDKEPVFEVTGLPENVDAARKEIEAHIAMRTGADSLGNSGSSSSSGGGPNGIGNIYGIGEHPLNHINNSESGGSGFSSAFSSSSLDHLNGGGSSKYSSILNGGHHQQHDYNKSGGGGLNLHNILDGGGSSGGWGDSSGNSHNPLTGTRSGGPGLAAWSSNGGTDDVRQHLSHRGGHRGSSPSSFESNGHHVPTHAELTGTGIWGELNINKMLGGLDLNGDDHPGGGSSAAPGNPLMMSLMNTANSGSGDSPSKSAFLSVGSRSSLDLGSLGRQQQQQPQQHQNPLSAGPAPPANSLDFGSSCSASTTSSNHTATPPNALSGGCLDSSPPVSLPPFGGGAGLHRASVSSEPATSSGLGLFTSDNDTSSTSHRRENSLDLNMMGGEEPTPTTTTTTTTDGIDSNKQPVNNKACEGISAERDADFLSFAK